MKIKDTANIYSAQLKSLKARRSKLRQTLKEQEKGTNTDAASSGVFDRLELSKELEALDAEYEATRQGLGDIMEKESLIHNFEAAKQQGEAMSKGYQELRKIMEVYRRIASGGTVPPEDEKKLMEYSSELYMAAKNMALLLSQKGEDYDSLWGDEDDKEGGEKQSASEIARNTEIDAGSPEEAEQYLSESQEITP